MPGLSRHGDAVVNVSDLVSAYETMTVSCDVPDIEESHKYIAALER